MIRNSIYCGALLGFWMLAMPAQAEDLRTYYEQQKLELAKTFVAPEAGAEITLVLLDGEEKSGVIRHLSETGVQILSDNALVTFRKHELDEASCAQLFADEYAHVEAIKRTRAHKQGSAVRTQRNTHQGKLSVLTEVERDGTRDVKNKDHTDGATTETETKTQTEVRNLKISVANRMAHPDTYTVKWYFFAQDMNKDSIYIQSRGSKEIQLKGREQVKHTISSEGCTTKKVARNYTACCGKSTSSEKKSGVMERGYLVVLKCGDEVLSREASSKHYLDPDWVKLCQ